MYLKIIKVICKTDSSNNKAQVDHFDSDHSIVRDNHFISNEDDGQTHFNNENNFEEESHDELDSPK